MNQQTPDNPDSFDSEGNQNPPEPKPEFQEELRQLYRPQVEVSPILDHQILDRAKTQLRPQPQFPVSVWAKRLGVAAAFILATTVTIHLMNQRQNDVYEELSPLTSNKSVMEKADVSKKSLEVASDSHHESPQSEKSPHQGNLKTQSSDLDGDGKVDIVDALLLAKRLEAGKESAENSGLDLNDDGRVSLEDAHHLAQRVVSLY